MITSLRRNEGLVYVMGKQIVLCEVETVFLNTVCCLVWFDVILTVHPANRTHNPQLHTSILQTGHITLSSTLASCKPDK